MKYLVIRLQVLKSSFNLRTEETVSSKGVDIQILAHADKLRTRKIVESQSIFKLASDRDNLLSRSLLASRAVLELSDNNLNK